MTTQTSASDALDLDDTETEAPSLALRVGAELLGTFLLVAAILTVAAFGSIGSSATVLYVALAGGLVLTGLVAALGSVSGAHLNPAVSLGAAVAGRLSWVDLAPYVVAQTVGAIGAGAVLRVTIPETLPAALGAEDVAGVIARTANGFGENSPLYTLSQGAVSVSFLSALVIEALATAILVGVVLGTTRRPNTLAPIAIGGALTVAILMAGQLTNGAINPARATGAAMFAGGEAIGDLGVFWLGPLLGALLAGVVVVVFQRHPQPEEEYWDDEDEGPEAGDAPGTTEVDERVLVVEQVGDPMDDVVAPSSSRIDPETDPDSGPAVDGDPSRRTD
jgi:aquaporin Z